MGAMEGRWDWVLGRLVGIGLGAGGGRLAANGSDWVSLGLDWVLEGVEWVLGGLDWVPQGVDWVSCQWGVVRIGAVGGQTGCHWRVTLGAGRGGSDWVHQGMGLGTPGIPLGAGGVTLGASGTRPGAGEDGSTQPHPSPPTPSPYLAAARATGLILAPAGITLNELLACGQQG